uniref:Uncharacterized protein n=1 Tax=Romanomermis culicivorax TaxID=13658 RepID=A0A915L208_ROMCU
MIAFIEFPVVENPFHQKITKQEKVEQKEKFGAETSLSGVQISFVCIFKLKAYNGVDDGLILR